MRHIVKSRYPHTTYFFSDLPDCWLFSYHHATIPIGFSVGWIYWSLCFCVIRNGRRLLSFNL